MFAFALPVPEVSTKATPFLNHLYSEAGDPSFSLHRSSTTVPLIAELGTSHVGVAEATEEQNYLFFQLYKYCQVAFTVLLQLLLKHRRSVEIAQY